MNEFLTDESFMITIERMVAQKKINHIEAVIEFCSQNSIDIEEILPLITRPLKEKIKLDAMETGMMKAQGILPV